jgi:hypothetical protein
MTILGFAVSSPFGQKVVWEIGQDFERSRQTLSFFAQNYFIAPAENLHLSGFQTALLRQPNGLTVT